MASPGCRRWWHKGRTSTNPALNRYGRSRSALYRADMAMGNPAQWSFHALRAQRPQRVITGSLGQVTRTSAPRCKADEIGGKADIGPRTSAFGVRADSLAYPMECLLVAISGHSGDAVNGPSAAPRRHYKKIQKHVALYPNRGMRRRSALVDGGVVAFEQRDELVAEVDER